MKSTDSEISSQLSGTSFTSIFRLQKSLLAASQKSPAWNVHSTWRYIIIVRALCVANHACASTCRLSASLPRCAPGKCGDYRLRAHLEAKREPNERKQKGNCMCCTVFISWNFYHCTLDTLPTVTLPWHCWGPIGTMKIGGLWCHLRAVCNLFLLISTKSSGLYLLMSLWRFVWIWPYHMWQTCLQHQSVSVLVTICWWWFFPCSIFCFYQKFLCSDGRLCKMADCLESDGTMRNDVAQLGVPICGTLSGAYCIAPWG